MKLTRQQRRYQRFKHHFAQGKEFYGCGVYSWSEGMTRAIARLIARRISKRPQDKFNP